MADMNAPNDLHYWLLSSLLTWVMLVTASLMRSGLTPRGVAVAFGNRDDVPDPSPATARAERAARNMLENLLLFTSVLAAARFRQADASVLTMGAAIFFWARLVYFVVYLAGIKVVRTLVWGVSLVGLGLIGFAAW